MKLQYIFLGLTISITASAGLYQQGQEKKAEEVYKNIKVFKGMPASEVIPAMKFMTASLKVDCEFCHKGDDFADETPHMKEEAREMILMQRDINTKHFNGRTEVTCNTCHNGSPNPQRVPALDGISRRSINRNATAVTPADVVKKFVTSTGELKSITMEGKVKGFAPETVGFKAAQGSPDKFLLDFGTRKFGFDGKVTWASENGKGGPVPDEYATEIQNFGRFFRGEHTFDFLGALRFAGTDKVDGKEVVVLRAGAQGAKVSTDLYFESGSGLLVRWVSYTTSSLGNIPSFVNFGDYRKVGDAMVPHVITRTGGKEPMVFTIEKTVSNPTLPATYFSLDKE